MRLRDWIRPASKPAISPGGAGRASAEDPAIPRYPPFQRGLPVTTPARILESQRELIAQLQDGLAFTDQRFVTLVRPVIARYAAFVHLLPASEAHHHRGAGGLFRHGLEVAFHAARASQGLIFALERSPGERRALEPRWHLAAGLAGLCHDLGKPIGDLSVTDRAGRTTWRPLLEPLTDWAAAQGVEHYYLRWRERRHRRHEPFGLLVLDRVLKPEVTAWLADPDPEILQGLLAAVAGIDDGAVLGRLVSAADQASVEQDLRENHIDPAATSLGVPVERYLLDAMRRLARGGRWQINVPGARLWLLAEGLHVVWPAGAQDVIALLAADKVPGIPRDPDTVADILLERGLAVPREEAGRTQRYWRLAPAPLARDGQTVTLAMLRLASPDVVLAGALPAPIEVVMEGSVIPRAAVSGNTPVVAPGPDEGDMSTHAAHVARHPHPPSPSTLDSSEPAGGTAVETRSNTHAAAPPPPVPGAVRSSDDTLAQDERVDEQRPQGAQQAETWFRARGQGGAALLSLGVALAREERAWDEWLRLIGDQVLICFPEGLAGLGASPQALLDALASAGLIETDPLAPLRRVRELAGARGALLTKETSRWFLTIAGPPPASRSATSGAIGTVRRPGLSPTSAGVAPNEAGRTETPSELHSAESAVRAAARELIALIRSRDPSIPGGVLQAEGGLSVGPGVAAWFVASHAAVNRYALLRALGKSEGCRIAANGGLTVAGKG